jgi:hypothetical protein
VVVTPERAPWPFQVAWLLLFVVPWVLALRHAAKHTEAEFTAVGASKTGWLLGLAFATIFAAVPYLFTVKRRLDAQRADRHEPRPFGT